MCADPELKQTQGGTSVCSFNIAVNRYSKDPMETKKVDFFTVVAWGPKAEFVCRNFKKGQAIIIVGRLENRDWQDKNGNKRISTEIIAEEISFAGNRESSTEAKNQPYTPTAYATPAFASNNQAQFEEIPSDEKLPFQEVTMARLKLKADTPYERAILRYLEANASEALEEKINNGNKTLAQCWKYITGEAKKEAKNGCAMIEDQKVYGWAIHFFEEDEIKAEAHESPSESTNDTPEERPAPKKAAPVAKGAVENQMSFDDLFG